MGSDNFFIPWVDSTTQFKADDMNLPLYSLDKAFSYTKNLMASCAGDISFVDGTLAWTDTITITYLDENKITITNRIVVGNIAVAPNKFVAVNLNAIDNTAIIPFVGTIIGNGPCPFANDNRIVLAYRSGGANLNYVNLQPSVGALDQAIYNFGELLNAEEQLGVYLIEDFWPGTPNNNQTILMHVLTPVTAEFAAGLPGSKSRCKSAPIGAQVFSVRRNGIEVGTMTFGAGSSVAVFAAAAGFKCNENDYLEVIAPASVDGSIANIAMTLKGSKLELFATTTTTTLPITTTTTV